MLIQAVLNKKFSTKSSYMLIETKKGVGLIPAVGLEQKRVSADSPLIVWDQKDGGFSFPQVSPVAIQIKRVSPVCVAF
ncbi:MAG: hypothetical protein JZU47_13400 [Prolixibacteraceae bacterium]|nr:hypothetical protein [Prolixibacteraceae bacterium]